MKQNDINVSHDKERLQTFLSLPGNSLEVSWELATLPEQLDGAISGPTDYVSLIAAVHLHPNDKDELLGKVRPPSSFQGFPTQFVRSWLSEEQKKALRRASTGERVNGLIDAGFLVKKDRPYRHAVGLVVNDVLVIYVNYVSP